MTDPSATGSPASVGSAPEPGTALAGREEQQARDDAEIAAFAAAQPAAKARAAARRALSYATAACIFVFLATVAGLRWLRASLPYLRVIAANARTCLAAEWIRAKEHASANRSTREPLL